MSKRKTNIQVNYNYESSAGSKISKLSSPLQYFKLFFTDGFIMNIVENTNKYGKKKRKQFTQITYEDFNAFTGIAISFLFILIIF